MDFNTIKLLNIIALIVNIILLIFFIFNIFIEDKKQEKTVFEVNVFIDEKDVFFINDDKEIKIKRINDDFRNKDLKYKERYKR